MKKNKVITQVVIIGLMLLETNLFFPAQSFAAPPNIAKTAPVNAKPGDPVTIKIGPINPGNLTGIADMVLTMDVSRSMRGPLSGVSCTLGTDCKVDIAKTAFTNVVNLLASNSIYNREAFVTFYGDKADPVAPSAWKTQVSLTNTAATLNNSISQVNKTPIPPGIPLGACTSIGGGVYQALSELKANGRGTVPTYIILATDGLQNIYPSVYDHYPTAADPTIIDQARTKGVKIFTVGIGIDPNNVSEFTQCQTHPDSAGPGVKGPFNPVGKYSDLNGNGILDGEDYLIDVANQTGATYKLVQNGSDFNNSLTTIINNIKFPFSFQINDVINSDIFDPINLNDVTLTKLILPQTNCDLATPVSAAEIVSKTRVPSPPLDPTYTNWSFRINTAPVPVTEVRCVEIKAKVKFPFPSAYGSSNVDSDNRGSGDNRDPGYWAKVFPTVPSLGITLPPIDINNRPIEILNPIPASKPWLQTTKGDVGSIGGFNFARTPTPTPNSQFLSIYKGSLNNFTSVKNWLVQRTGAEQISLGNVSNYGKLLELVGTTCPKTLSTPPTSSLPSGRGKFSFPASTSVVWNGLMDSADCPGFNENTTIMFVNGNLTINNNFPSVGTNPTVVIVKGDININPSVTSLRGVFIADGVIRTGSGAAQLTVTGSLIGSLGVSGAPFLQRDLGNICSSRCNLNDPAEIINFDPSYLYYFRNTLGVTKSNLKEERP